MPLDFNKIKNIHLVGVGGCGVSGIAKILHEMGFKVSGSDVKENPNTVRLKDMGVKIQIGHDADNVRGIDLMVYSSAVSFDNPELKEGQAKGIPILKRAEMLAWIMSRSQNRIAVAGTHGKTTTTAMIAKVLDAAKLNPTFLIGCDMDYVGGNAKMGSGGFCVAEADESDSSFLFLSPTIEIITNIEEDHMEHFGNTEELFRTFEEFASRVPANGFILVDGTDPNNRRLMERAGKRFITYGLDPGMEYSAKNLKHSKFNSSYILLKNGEEVGEVGLSVPGWQNVLNSLAVFAIGFEFGIDFSLMVSALQTFVGARRRFSIVGEQSDIMIIDDYAHHPTEIKATLSAARAGWPKRKIVCVFQPHRYTRTKLLKDRFGTAFSDADRVIISDIYAASEKPIPGISGKTIANLLDKEKASYIPKKEKIVEQLMKELKPGDMLLTVGAGDIYTVAKEILLRLKMRDHPDVHRDGG
ncbi:UDP-N-acetylmuramate--L-alanine ligase [candidate division WOR-1 bacterium RIFOXYA12_FULL_52_29]|uniref:UDP-N-acetylmuramate--L-alanine ligase n=1 Tax=candidate division WOR-1 bacterium RIFOXYC12_FULL_54_18 TaxID=1802584 RepID=A0A1F4T5E5_UNCSA|nr:MAG: UDP-N-acetylmuramate--L-alanine ligase [candidate division WOR-1 bacterium RIFOXYA2_FULL_51_19]OGC17350.1 MAG: UDP-N-acetylmuramate--L-alanine ligase [candidate division WOR-1 bacterium RIFOXYA12_FULL_52_29]OGC26209.1 MAG: UDP-N-acetylmuramate--L-alanine ligase [candidate division WOR-1 bacterium RIFOXYB2_FULL_45_9]OGC27767.1 MAG: UDP-N-acetylmuramate--L-alanine ligase [candidate division WOR-1 bacterium RIFOXYC12_FULL_54_18]OGC29943.1 MAG: UDP-N-acetylmuramate--L-alanine ligase [candid